jgi:predicted TIM-barrel fold metal-dependent hydrolase
MTQTRVPVLDADNHYYEVADAFTRYLPRDMHRRGLQWAQMDGKTRLLAGGRITRVLANPTFNPIARPGSLGEYFRAQNVAGKDVKDIFGELDRLEDHPEYVDRDARLKVIAQQGIDGALLFPTLGVLLQRPLANDIDALHATYRAFNEWLFEDWGFGAPLYGVPVIALSDPLLALDELKRVLDQGAKVVGVIPGPVPKRHGGSSSPAARDLDPVWQTMNDSGVLVAIHGTDGVLDHYLSEWEEPNEGFAIFDSGFKMAISQGRPISDTVTALIFHGLFERFPDLRIATIETGSNWVGPLLRTLESVYKKRPHQMAENPVDTFKRHFWVSPFFEDDMSNLRNLIGAERMLFGSDWPHAEGLATPKDFLGEIPSFDKDEVPLVMGANLASLVGAVPS